MHPEEVNAKLKAEYEQAQCGQAVPTRDPYYGDAQTVGKVSSLREQAEHLVGYHRTQADKHDRAAAFFRENPAFDQFIQLVRSGAIQF